MDHPSSLDRHSTTVTQVVEGCVYICGRFYNFFLLKGEFRHSALSSSPSSQSYNTTKIRKLVRLRGGQIIRARALRATGATHDTLKASRPSSVRWLLGTSTEPGVRRCRLRDPAKKKVQECAVVEVCAVLVKSRDTILPGNAYTGCSCSPTRT